MPQFQVLLDSFLSFLFPDSCAGCKRLGALLCPGCRAALTAYPQQQCPRLDGLSGLVIGYVFEEPLRTVVHQLKYRRRRRLAQPLGNLLAAQLANRQPPVDVLVPVPLHAERLAERGFNQAEELARHVGAVIGLPVATTGLVRLRATGQQARLDAQQRRANVRDAFAWRGAGLPPRVLLIDDVLTTGATMSACASVLRGAGVREVYGLALARSRPAA